MRETLCISKTIFYSVLALLFVCAPLSAADIPSHPLLKKAQEARRPRVQFALENNAQVRLTSDGKSFSLLWLPQGTDIRNPPPIIVTLHGHDGWAFDAFYVWHQHFKDSGYGFLALQWWLGEGESMQDYLSPDEIYQAIDEIFSDLHVKTGKALLHGFSRGSSNSYAVAAIDHTQGKKYFSLIISDAGRASPGYPPNREIEKGKFGEKPFQGLHWITYAGGLDPNPERDGIAGMRETAAWIQKFGGTVDLAIEDPDNGHGGFHRNPENTKKALDVFEKQLSSNK
jgi:hypothetical protein